MNITDPKKITFSEDVREKILNGAKQISDAVGSTMGPGGQLVIYRTPGELYPVATKDGVSVARRIFLEDEEENIASMMIMQAANRQLQESGDGTTLTCVLAYAFIQAAYDLMNNGVDVVRFLRHLEMCIDTFIQILRAEAIPCASLDNLEPVAVIATNGNKELGKLIAEAVFKVGTFGQVLCEKSQTHETRVEYLDGYQFESGIEFAEFMNNPAKGGCEYENPLVLVTDHEIAWARQILPLLERIARSPDWNPDKPLIIFSPNVRDEALQVIVKNVVDKKFLCVPIKPQGIATEKKYCLEDLAAVTGARYISEQSGIRLEDVQLDMLGTCARINSRKGKTILAGAKNEKREELVKTIITNSEDAFEKDLAQKSLAKLQGAVAVVYVGGHSETEQKEVMDRVDDAIRASKSALEEGIVPGGGVTILKIAKKVFDVHKDHFGKDQEKAATILLQAAKGPIRRILTNCNKKPESIIDGILKNTACGYDIELGKPLSMVKGVKIHGKNYTEHNPMIFLGIVDPVKVIRTAMLNSVSVAKTLIRTNVLITPNKKDEQH